MVSKNNSLHEAWTTKTNDKSSHSHLSKSLSLDSENGWDEFKDMQPARSIWCIAANRGWMWMNVKIILKCGKVNRENKWANVWQRGCNWQENYWAIERWTLLNHSSVNTLKVWWEACGSTHKKFSAVFVLFPSLIIFHYPRADFYCSPTDSPSFSVRIIGVGRTMTILTILRLRRFAQEENAIWWWTTEISSGLAKNHAMSLPSKKKKKIDHTQLDGPRSYRQFLGR